MAKEQQGQQVHETCNTQEQFKLLEQDFLVETLVAFRGVFWLSGEVVQHNDIGDVVHEAHEEDEDDQGEEFFVVLFAYTIVEPFAVVVEAMDTAVACTAVLGVLEHESLADLTLKLVVSAVELLSIEMELVSDICNTKTIDTYPLAFASLTAWMVGSATSALVATIAKYRTAAQMMK